MVLWSRAHGGGWPKLPYSPDAWLLCAPYFLFFPAIGYWTIPAYLGAVLGIRLGHGRGFDYHLPFKPDSKPERIEVLIPSNLPVYWHKALIMLLTGLAVTLVASVVLAFHGYLGASAILALSGALKTASYLLPKTEYAEIARGLFLGLGVVLAYGMI